MKITATGPRGETFTGEYTPLNPSTLSNNRLNDEERAGIERLFEKWCATLGTTPEIALDNNQLEGECNSETETLLVQMENLKAEKEMWEKRAHAAVKLPTPEQLEWAKKQVEMNFAE